MQIFLKTLIILFLFQSTYAQLVGGVECSSAKIKSWAISNKNAKIAYPGDPKIDIKYHNIKLIINPDSKYIKGSVETIFTALSPVSDATFDLKTTLKVDSIVSDGKKLSFTHSANKIIVVLAKSLAINDVFKLTIYYQGTPPTSTFGSFTFGTHGSNRAPAISTLSESFGAPDWWPCKDDLLDKIDSSEVSINLPSYFASVSNGNLKSVDTNSNGTRTYVWKNSYPIAHYLISIACSNYVNYDSEFLYNGKKIPILNYLYPESATTAVKKLLDETPKMMKFFSDIFGEYPFMKEKYGHAMFTFGGGMEHQTISSMGGFSESLIAHELAHQWFGDKITCKTWADIFVNEAFASYSESLYDEFKYGQSRYLTTMNEHILNAKKTTKPVFISNPSDENLIFDYDITYSKGAVILHMLRGVVGDEMFFKSLKNYMSSSMAYGVASIDDFRASIEKTSNLDLKYFFDEWVYGLSYPKYAYSWKNTGAKETSIQINQEKLKTSPNYFKMPVQLLLKFDNSKDSLVTVFADEISKTFVIKNLNGLVTSVVFDPNSLIMKEVSEVSFTGLITGIEPTERKYIIYPNPSTAQIEIKSSEEKILNLEIRNTQGKLMKIIKEPSNSINISELPAGKYLITIYLETTFHTESIIKL